MKSTKQTDRVLECFEPERRKALRMIALGTAVYVAPTVASFSMSGLGDVAHAQSGNQTPTAKPVPAVSSAGVGLAAGAVAAASACALRKDGDK